MNIQVLLFGIAADLLKSDSLEITVTENCTIYTFKKELLKRHPKLLHLASYAVAVNETYADDDVVLKENDVVALIPPVSGG